MSTLAEADLLYPLTLFHRHDGVPLPAFEALEGDEVPQPYRRLLVHTGDMTSRLQAFHEGEIFIEVMQRAHTAQAYRREVILRMEEDRLPVEYGAIEIELEVLEPELRQLILAEHLPLGGLLNAHRVAYYSRPKAFLRLETDERMAKLFGVDRREVFYGRCNELLLEEDDRVLARIVEVLRP
jgi:chorismate-pyruvate lyase